MDEEILNVELLEEAKAFIESQPAKAAEKIYFNMRRIERGERNAEIFKKLEGTNLWEFRTQFNKISYRMLSFWDSNSKKLVIVTHGFVKKTQKTPLKEIEKGESIRKIYLGII